MQNIKKESKYTPQSMYRQDQNSLSILLFVCGYKFMGPQKIKKIGISFLKLVNKQVLVDFFTYIPKNCDDWEMFVLTLCNWRGQIVTIQLRWSLADPASKLFPVTKLLFSSILNFKLRFDFEPNPTAQRASIGCFTPKKKVGKVGLHKRILKVLGKPKISIPITLLTD